MELLQVLHVQVFGSVLWVDPVTRHGQVLGAFFLQVWTEDFCKDSSSLKNHLPL